MSTLLPHQIVYLQKGNRRLYAETIQIVTDRHLCWARPLVLVTASQNLNPVAPWDTLSSPDKAAIHLLMDGPDILWPLDQFYPALDTEVIPLLSLLQDGKQKASDRRHTHEQLHQFIREFWQG